MVARDVVAKAARSQLVKTAGAKLLDARPKMIALSGPGGFLGARVLDAVLDVENPELFKWLTAQETAPREMRENEAYASLAAHLSLIHI